MEFLIGLGVTMVAASAVVYVCSSLWFYVRWHLFGWRPKILDEKVVEQTVSECTVIAVANDIRYAAEEYGYEMSEEEQDEHLKLVEKTFRQVIECYIRNFALKV